MSTDNKQNLRANKLHLNLIWVIYSSDLNHSLGTFLYPWYTTQIMCIPLYKERIDKCKSEPWVRRFSQPASVKENMEVVISIVN